MVPVHRAGDEVGTFSSLAIDRFGAFHIAYSNRAGIVLRYAFRGKNDKQWYTMAVDRGAGSFNSLAVDSHGWPHIAYNSPSETGLHYASWDGKQWHKLIIDHDMTNHFTSIQLDSQDQAQISYYREEYPDRHYALYLKYAYFDGKSWYIQTIDHRFGTGKFNSIALDSLGHPYIAYSIVGTGDLGLAHFNGSKWALGVVDSRSTSGNSYVGYHNSIVVDSAGEPHIGYLDGTKYSVKYARREGATWHREVVDSLAALGSEASRVSLKLDSHGRPHVAYYDAGLGALKYAVRDIKGWRTELVDNNGNVAGYASLCLDEHDEPHISYYADGQLRIAHHQPPPVSVRR